ncbi:unnamed protein product [Onchocerca flexuosa]|uniref:Uncharacterized protein n=1 Tax=Onchocerca flexuosa TaxID=387005 RepID=A0A183HSU0_9BILA|nr:unnamed protein product [Onchocerca flexuosa]
MPNFDPSPSIPDPNDDLVAVAGAAASQSETSSATIAPHFPTTQTSASSSSTLATWQWLRGRIFDSFTFKQNS